MNGVCGGETKAPADVKQEESESGPCVLPDPGLLDVFVAEGEREVGAGDKEKPEI